MPHAIISRISFVYSTGKTWPAEHRIFNLKTRRPARAHVHDKCVPNVGNDTTTNISFMDLRDFRRAARSLSFVNASRCCTQFTTHVHFYNFCPFVCCSLGRANNAQRIRAYVVRMQCDVRIWPGPWSGMQRACNVRNTAALLHACAGTIDAIAFSSCCLVHECCLRRACVLCLL